MIPCREVVQILGSGQEASIRKRIEMRIHLMMCRHCTAYFKQLRMLKKISTKIFSSLSVDSSRTSAIELEAVKASRQKT